MTPATREWDDAFHAAAAPEIDALLAELFPQENAMADVPTRLVIVGELAWRAKKLVECFLGFTPWRKS